MANILATTASSSFVICGLTFNRTRVVEEYTYSADRMQMTRQTAKQFASSVTLMELSYSYQAAAGASGAGTSAGNSGQLMSVSGTVNGASRNQSFTYDDVGRLATATTGWDSTKNRRYEYDRWGNRTAVWNAVSGGTKIQDVVIAKSANVENNQILTADGVVYGYDGVGNLTSDGQHSYVYDGESRIASVDGGAASYVYDSANRRVKRVAGGATTYYIWEGSQVIAEYSSGVESTAGTTYYQADKLSMRAMSDSGGAWKGSQDHLAFGEEAGVSGTSEKHRFTSYERDSESGSDYAVNRQYSYSTGRFNRPDPVGGSIGNPQSFNRYSYSLNDPVNLVDPVGLNYCPPEFPSCFQADVFIPGFGGIRTTVGVGNDGSGTFLWDQFAARGPRSKAAAAEIAGGGLPATLVALNIWSKRNLIRNAVDIALEKLKDRFCLEYIRGNTMGDPEGALKNIARDRIKPDSSIGKATADIDLNTGLVRLNDAFFGNNSDKDIFSPANRGKGLTSVRHALILENYSLPPESAFSNDMARATILLHEIKHFITGIAHPYDANGNEIPGLSNSTGVWNREIIKRCFAR